MSIIKSEYENFLEKIKLQNISEIEFIKFIRDYYLPRPTKKIVTERIKIEVKPGEGRDYVRYKFNSRVNVNKRMVIYFLIKDLLSRGISIDEINKFCIRTKIIICTNKMIEDIEKINPLHYKRYHTKTKLLIENKYAVYCAFPNTQYFLNIIATFQNEFHNINIERM